MEKKAFPFLDQITIDNVQNKITESLNEIQYYPPLKVLKIIKLFDVLSKKGQYSEVQESAENIQLREIKRYLTSIYMSNKFDNPASYKICDYKNIKILFGKIYDACKEATLYLMFNQRNDKINKEAWLHESVDGRTYTCFSYQILTTLLSAQADLIKKCYYIEYEDFDAGLERLWKQLVFVQVPSHYKETELLIHIDEIIDRSNCCIEDITGWPSQLIKDLSYELGECTEYFCRDKYPGWYGVEMPITKKPFMRIDGFSYCFDHNICFDCFYRALQKVIQSKSSDLLNEWKKNQTKITEKLTGELLTNVFQGAQSYNNIYYKSDKTWMETDGLILYNNLIINYEVKGGAYTPDSIYMDSASHKKAEEALIVKAIRQTKRFMKQIRRDRKIDLYDESYNLIRSVTIKDETLLISIAVTLEPLGEINCMYNNGIHKDPENEGVIVLSLYDLIIYCNFFTSPIFFAHYLSERIKPINKIPLSNSDELNYLGNYLDDIHFFTSMNEVTKNNAEMGNASQIILAPAYEDIDKYFALGMQCARPDFHVNKFLKKIIFALDDSKCSNKIEMGLFLLNLSEHDQEHLQKNVNIILDRQNKRHIFSSMILKHPNDEKRPIFLFANRGNCYATINKAREYAIAYSIAFQCYNVQYLIIDFQPNDSIVIHSGIVNENSALMYASGYFDELINWMRMQFSI